MDWYYESLKNSIFTFMKGQSSAFRSILQEIFQIIFDSYNEGTLFYGLNLINFLVIL